MNMNTPKTNYRLTEKQKTGIQKMIEYFDGFGYRDIEFQIWIGVLPDGTPHHITLNGKRVVKHLKGVLDFEVYGEDGRDILNGIRECYSNALFQMRK